jgi:hypothetical protein
MVAWWRAQVHGPKAVREYHTAWKTFVTDFEAQRPFTWNTEC